MSMEIPQEISNPFGRSAEADPRTARLKELGLNVKWSEIKKPTSEETIPWEAFGDKSAAFKEHYRYMRNWIELPWLYDDFKDPLERREWRYGLDKEDRSLVEDNKLRTNLLTTVLLHLEVLKNELKQAPRFSKLSGRFSTLYEEMTLPEAEESDVADLKIVRKVIKTGADAPMEERERAIRTVESKVLRALRLLEKYAEQKSRTLH